MQIWSAEIKELETLCTSIKGKFPELEKDLEHLIKTDDENVALLYSRRCLEIIVTDLCESELKRPRGTEPLKGLIDKLSHEKKVPSNIIASMEGLNTLSTFGTHPKEFDPEQVKPVLSNLAIIIKWYIKYKDTQIFSQAKQEEEKSESKESVENKEDIKIPKKRLVFLVSGILIVVAIVVVTLFVFNVIGGKKETREIEKSIAVLPFKLLSDEPDKQYLADGMMDAILLHLSKIEDLRVLSRTSTEQYKESGKTMTEIGRELGVSYLLEGSFQKYGDDVRLIVQLIQSGKEGHLWANQYDRKWNDIFSVQSEVAQTIAGELNAIITPEEKQLIEKTPTTSLTAYDFYTRGKEEYWKYWSDKNNRKSLERAEDLYNQALEYDSLFALSYAGLARIYWEKHYWKEFFSENFMDSVLILADVTLSLDNQLAEAYVIRGSYYGELGNLRKSIEEFDKAIMFNSNDWMAYYGKAYYYWYKDDINAINNLYLAISLNRGPELPTLLRLFSFLLSNNGLIEKSDYYLQAALKLDGDSLTYLSSLVTNNHFQGNQEKAIEFGKKAYAMDTTNVDILNILGHSYMFLDKNKESLKYFKQYVNRLNNLGNLTINTMHRIGYAYWVNGYKEKAQHYFDEQINYCNKIIELSRDYGGTLFIYYDLAGAYAFRGEYNKAFENLRIFNQRESMPYWAVYYIKNDPLFDSIREKPEFQQIVRDVEAKYQAEHERVRKWLEEQGML